MAEVTAIHPSEDPTGVGSDRPAHNRVTVTVRYFAAARAAADTTDEHLTVVTGPEVCTIGDVLDAAVGRHGRDLQRILLRCSYLLDGVAVHGRETPVTDGQSVDVLPPFAGG